MDVRLARAVRVFGDGCTAAVRECPRFRVRERCVHVRGARWAVARAPVVRRRIHHVGILIQHAVRGVVGDAVVVDGDECSALGRGRTDCRRPKGDAVFVVPDIVALDDEVAVERPDEDAVRVVHDVVPANVVRAVISRVDEGDLDADCVVCKRVPLDGVVVRVRPKRHADVSVGNRVGCDRVVRRELAHDDSGFRPGNRVVPDGVRPGVSEGDAPAWPRTGVGEDVVFDGHGRRERDGDVAVGERVIRDARLGRDAAGQPDRNRAVHDLVVDEVGVRDVIGRVFDGDRPVDDTVRCDDVVGTAVVHRGIRGADLNRVSRLGGRDYVVPADDGVVDGIEADTNRLVGRDRVIDDFDSVRPRCADRALDVLEGRVPDHRSV